MESDVLKSDTSLLKMTIDILCKTQQQETLSYCLWAVSNYMRTSEQTLVVLKHFLHHNLKLLGEKLVNIVTQHTKTHS